MGAIWISNYVNDDLELCGAGKSKQRARSKVLKQVSCLTFDDEDE